VRSFRKGRDRDGDWRRTESREVETKLHVVLEDTLEGEAKIML
jgi:hypothetical protein